MWHMEVPRLGVKSELYPLAYATATAIWDLSHVCNLHCSSWHHWILNPLSEARDGTLNLMVPSWIHFRYSARGTPTHTFLILRTNLGGRTSLQPFPFFRSKI